MIEIHKFSFDFVVPVTSIKVIISDHQLQMNAYDDKGHEVAHAKCPVEYVVEEEKK